MGEVLQEQEWEQEKGDRGAADDSAKLRERKEQYSGRFEMMDGGIEWDYTVQGPGWATLSWSWPQVNNYKLTCILKLYIFYKTRL